MVGELVLFQPSNKDYLVGIGLRNADGSVNPIKVFTSWDDVRAHSDEHMRLGKTHINLGIRLRMYCNQFSKKTEIPPSILEAFKEKNDRP